MKPMVFIFSFLMLTSVFAKEYGWGTVLENEVSKIKIGGRIQAIMEHESETETQDLYLRRTRLNLEYKPWQGHTFVYDIRNDGANQADKGEKTFNIGDAYWKIDINKFNINNIKLFRAKVDVSYSQTSSSKNLFNPQRAEVSEFASDFVVHNRRAANVQLNGNFGQLAYQAVISDGVNSEDLEDLSGQSVNEVSGQKFTYGSKVRYFFIGDAKKNKAQDTFYGLVDTFSFGVGYFANDKIILDNSNNLGSVESLSIRRELTNLELSYSNQNFRFLAEYFDMKGSLIDLGESSKREILGESDGYYVQLEYLFGKWAPYIIYESFNKNKDSTDSNQIVKTIGLNFYQRLEATRFGIAIKNTQNEKAIGDDTQDALYAYAMVNF